MHLVFWASEPRAGLGRLSGGVPLGGTILEGAHQKRGEASEAASGSAAAGAPAPPPQPDVVISLHSHCLARPRPLLPYKAALPPREVGVSSRPLYRWGAEAPEVLWLKRKQGRNFTANQHLLAQHPTPSNPHFTRQETDLPRLSE